MLCIAGIATGDLSAPGGTHEPAYLDADYVMAIVEEPS
jgi:hypothetical protein